MFSNRDLQKLIVPLTTEQVLPMLAGIVDTVIASYVGEAGISGVALMDMVNCLIITVLSAVVMGGVAVISQYLGGEERENANRTASQPFSITFLISMGITVSYLLFCRGILGALSGGVEVEVMRVMQDYLFVTLCSLLFLGVYNPSSILSRFMNRTRIIMYVSFSVNVMNVARNAIGVLILHVGVVGAAVPTLLSKVATATIMPILPMQSRYKICITWKNLVSRNQGTAAWALKIAIPNGVENGLFVLGRVFVTSIVALLGATQITASGVVGNIDQIALIAASAISPAIIPVVRQCIGVGECGQATHYIKKFTKITYMLTGGMGGTVIVILSFILGFYELSEETYRISVLLIILHNALVFLLHPTPFVLANSLRAAGDAKIIMYIGTGSIVVFRLGATVLFGIILGVGVAGVWVTVGTDWFARTMTFSIRYRSGKRRCVKVI